MSIIEKETNISKDWFYLFDKDFFSKIKISPNVKAIVFFSDLKNEYDFEIWDWASLEFYWLFRYFSPEKLYFYQKENNSKLLIKSLYINSKENLTSKISSFVNWEKNLSDIKITSIIKDNKLSLDTSIEIEKWAKDIEWYLDVENIYIWDKWSSRWIPTLKVSSDSVKASHALKTSRIDENKIFYLTSRWLRHNDALNMLIESYFHNIFWDLKDIEKWFYENIYDKFLDM